MGAQTSFRQSYLYLGEEEKILLAQSENGDMTLYLDGQGIDEHLGEVSEVRGPKAYVTDHLGSVLNGEAAGSAKAFGAFGERLDSSPIVFNESTPPVLYGFTGRELDPESMNYHYRARTYSPELGRLVQPDPIGFEAGDANLYRYVGNSPPRFVDPSGLDFIVFDRANDRGLIYPGDSPSQKVQGPPFSIPLSDRTASNSGGPILPGTYEIRWRSSRVFQFLFPGSQTKSRHSPLRRRAQSPQRGGGLRGFPFRVIQDQIQRIAEERDDD